MVYKDEVDGAEEDEQPIEFDEELEVVVVIEFDLGVHDLVDVSVEVEFLAAHGC